MMEDARKNQKTISVAMRVSQGRGTSLGLREYFPSPVIARFLVIRISGGYLPQLHGPATAEQKRNRVSKQEANGVPAFAARRVLFSG
jgi:hypothetical protein